jgi:hypothetical protein
VRISIAPPEHARRDRVKLTCFRGILNDVLICPRLYAKIRHLETTNSYFQLQSPRDFGFM